MNASILKSFICNKGKCVNLSKPNAMASDPETTVHIWKIRHFSSLLKLTDKIKQTEFSLNNEENVKFSILVWPNEPESANRKGSYMRIRFGLSDECERKFQCRISIMDDDDEEWIGVDGITFSVICGGKPTFIDLPELVIHNRSLRSDKDQVLPGDKLTIKAVVSEHIETNVPQLQSDFSSLLNDSTLSDVVLELGNRQFHLHRAILAARSRVFKEMFTNDVQGPRESNRVAISNITAKAFEQTLEFIYAGKVNNLKEFAGELFEFAGELFEFAQKYKIDSLVKITEIFLSGNLSIQNVIGTLKLAELHKAKELKKNCFKFIKSNSESVQQQYNWGTLRSKPELLLEVYNKAIELKSENVIKVLIFADDHNDSRLKKKCIEFIKENIDEVKKRRDWKELKKERQELSVELLMDLV